MGLNSHLGPPPRFCRHKGLPRVCSHPFSLLPKEHRWTRTLGGQIAHEAASTWAGLRALPNPHSGSSLHGGRTWMARLASPVPFGLGARRNMIQLIQATNGWPRKGARGKCRPSALCFRVCLHGTWTLALPQVEDMGGVSTHP